MIKWVAHFRLFRLIIWGGNKKMQMYGTFEGFPPRMSFFWVSVIESPKDSGTSFEGTVLL